MALRQAGVKGLGEREIKQLAEPPNVGDSGQLVG